MAGSGDGAVWRGGEVAGSGWLEVLRVAGPVTVQDAGRPGLAHQGVPPGGALVPELLAAANRAVGNPWGAAALERFGALELCLRGRAGWVATEGWVRRVAEGERLRVPAPEGARVGYVAVEGGLAVPTVLGGRGTLLVAALGGGEGRALRVGDRLPLGAPPADAGVERAPSVGWAPELEARVRVIVGPDRTSAEALTALLESTFTVSAASDRVGLRLTGAPLPDAGAGGGASRPMVRGALQVPPSGEPIALGPDHPTTGGYPVVAVVARADQGWLGARRPGASVRFRAVSPREAAEAWRAHAERWLAG